MVISKRLGIILGIAIVILIIPLIAMQFTSEVNWDIGDFIIAGILLLGTGILLELILTKSKKHKTLLIVTVIVLLLLIWMEMSVGIFGSPIAGS
ncbi:hypothetical protein [Winogradskyella vincentii]|uniref:Uncharacterized protein n=1 Tax=Winogradskyella vincentii TaxID=2877122 RepID=A0ABS7XVH9_9FLAO|nr:hypothetical protein [Winogradskyella vincentii]MCA0151644.1 hypothetical protein [Winogradskyella vincentii]